MFCGPDSSSGATSHGLRLRRRRDKPAWEKGTKESYIEA